ncbi:MAG: ATP-binding cassette domain-containing protein [Gordonia sp. (in: high G+C Gram-positive bacteria)]
MTALLSCTGLVKRFRGSDVRAVDGVSFELARDEALGLVGESGSGKSTLARLVGGLISPDGGSVRVDGVEVVGASRGQMRSIRRKMQFVFQDPYSSLDPRMTVRELVTEGLLVHGIDKRDTLARRDRVVAAIEAVGLDPADIDRYPRSFSGGQRQRIAIARAVVLEPELLICDEPVSALDVSTQAQIVKLLSDLRGRYGLSLLFVAHDLAVVRSVCDSVAVMNRGSIVEFGECDAVYSDPQHPYTARLLAAVPIPDPVRERARRAAKNREQTDTDKEMTQ